MLLSTLETFWNRPRWFKTDRTCQCVSCACWRKVWGRKYLYHLDSSRNMAPTCLSNIRSQAQPTWIHTFIVHASTPFEVEKNRWVQHGATALIVILAMILIVIVDRWHWCSWCLHCTLERPARWNWLWAWGKPLVRCPLSATSHMRLSLAATATVSGTERALDSTSRSWWCSA